MATRTEPHGLLRAYEPSTDFPTVEDEAPCPRARGWAVVALAAGIGIVIGLLLGWWLGREGVLAIALAV